MPFFSAASIKQNICQKKKMFRLLNAGSLGQNRPAGFLVPFWKMDVTHSFITKGIFCCCPEIICRNDNHLDNDLRCAVKVNQCCVALRCVYCAANQNAQDSVRCRSVIQKTHDFPPSYTEMSWLISHHWKKRSSTVSLVHAHTRTHYTVETTC